jgi:hypothetical protein
MKPLLLIRADIAFRRLHVRMAEQQRHVVDRPSLIEVEPARALVPKVLEVKIDLGEFRPVPA